MKEIKQIYNMLEDEESKEIYLKRLNYLISGKRDFLNQIIDLYVPDLGHATNELYKDIENKYGEKDVVIWGCGFYIESNMDCWKKIKNIKCFCDRNKELQKTGYCGYHVISPETLFEYNKDIVIVIGTSNYFHEMKAELIDKGFSSENIVNFGCYVSMCSSRQYFEENFIQYENEEVFVDAGSYDLFTTKKLQCICGGKLKKSYAFEPDKKNYEKCKRIKEKENLSYIDLLPYGTWDKTETLRFSGNGTASSDISTDGKCEIQTRAIDTIVNDKVTFIKMDVEGAELKSLIGAKKTIIKYKPKLAICIYHKPEDMTEIPLYIKKLVPEYKFYIRHYSNNECETVLYAVL